MQSIPFQPLVESKASVQSCSLCACFAPDGIFAPHNGLEFTRKVYLSCMNSVSPRPYRQIRAVYDDLTLRVYQAYSDGIADAALAKGTFVSPPFKMDRMTWIKPSFLWMMYRSGWALKDPEQMRILAIDITREGFEWALSHSSLSHPAPQRVSPDGEPEIRTSPAPVRIQWDPERDLLLRPLEHRAIQIGLGKEAVDLYVRNWVRRITDVSSLARQIHQLVARNELVQARAMLPAERPYPASSSLERQLGMHVVGQEI
jgi:hypothetical protein